jgi:hypothetical protein
MARISTLVLIATLVLAGDARAQDQWGFSAGLTPSWHTADPVRFLFGADQVDISGSEARFGVVRGNLLEGDWGFSFVDKSIDENSTVEVDQSSCSRGQCGTFYRTLAHTRLTGVEFHQFEAMKTWRDRVQLGLVGAVGVGWLRGTLYKHSVSDQADVESFSAPADELFPPSASVVPLMRLELAVTGIVGANLKVRVGGGFGMPGYHTFGISLFYFVPQY